MASKRTAVFWVVMTACMLANGQSAPPPELDLNKLHKIEFRPDSSKKLSVQPCSGYLADQFRLLGAYHSGADILSKYKEPIVTRGSTGIAIFRSASPAVVLIVVGNTVNKKFTLLGEGSGAIINSAGYVLTNWHVVNGANTGIVFLKPTVGTEPSDNKAYVASLVYASKLHDLALLKLIDAPANLPFLTIADLASIQVAEDVHIIGHPHGRYWSYSTGVVSQVRGDHKWSYADGSEHEARVLQMQTAINPGNSGGPVLDDSGRMVGLVAASEEGQNLDYAIAADELKAFVALGMQMKTRGEVSNDENCSPEGEISRGTISPDLAVTRYKLSELLLYVVSSEKNGILGIVAESPNATYVGWKAEGGKFQYVEATFPDGHRVLEVQHPGEVPKFSIR